ncbi:DUF4347 domain-containing protein [Iningainema tapete]|uniref:DUF4347 domain-containing protein n=1 Tax=Iningainema tapete BLCC-T55 TaxID=2748662 RepID=A0A8J6XHV4_9CYAN|nr:DUF4347 domain-containing protein [Iningainema tapete]MBD2776229.1 DUF4347 domain-containing protein [Iningainema tapete BLCC-T55]
MKITDILFIDPSVSHYEILLKIVVPGIQVVVLKPEQDGVAQITQVLRQYNRVEKVHIVSHGSSGTLYLGNSELSLNTLELYTNQLQNWFPPTPKLTNSPTLLLYGCKVAAGDAGEEFITKLHQLTGANVAASANLTGNGVLGGDWNLEVTRGNISNHQLAFSGEVKTAYPSVLVAPTLSDTNITLTAINENATVPVGAVGTPIFNLVTLGGNVSDSDPNAITGIAIISIDTSNGNWFYTTNNGSNWANVGSVSDSNALLLAANAITRIYFQPNANFNGILENALTFRAWDQTSGVNGSTADTTANGGTSAFSSEIDTASITVNAVNDAPILSDTSVILNAVDEDAGTPIGAVGTIISELLSLGGNVTDLDTNAVTGIAITNANTTNGSFFYSTDDGNNWEQLEFVSNSNARLLAADGFARIYFQPNANFSGSISNALTFRAWDQTSGTNSSTADTTISGGTTAFSNTVDTAAITVNAVNDAPNLSEANVTLTTVNENAVAPIGAVGILVSSLVRLGDNVIDPDSNAVTGIAITSAETTNGTWFYSIDNGSNWIPLGLLSDTNSRLLAANAITRLYFQPNANFNGILDNALTFRAWDQTSGTNGSIADSSANGDTTAFSSVTNTATITVNAVNDAPTLSDTNIFLNIDEDAGVPAGAVGTLVSSLVSLGSNVTDPDSNAVTGVAIANANTTNGNWFYSTNDGGNWLPLGAVTNSTARLLAADAITRLYFQPNTNFNGSLENALTFRAWDQTSGSNGSTADTTISGGTTAFSTATDTVAITVNAVNDAPTLRDTNVVLTAINQGAGTPIGAVGTLVSSLVSLGSNGNVTDPDSAVTGIAITNTDNTNGNWFYSTDAGNNWIPLGFLSNTNARLLAADANTRVYFQPNANFSGVLSNALTFRAWDQTSGTSGSTADTTANGGATAFSSATDTGAITINAVGSPPTNAVNNPSTNAGNNPFILRLLSNNLFQLQGGSDTRPKLEVTLTGRSSNQVNELGVFVVDDDQGRINGILPSAENYAQVALSRARAIFSVIANVPRGFNTDITRLLEFNSGERLRFVLVNNSTIDAVQTGSTPLTNVLFGDPSTQRVTDLGNGNFTLAWKDASNSSTANFQDLVVNVRATNQQLPLGSGIQGNSFAELIDLRGVTTQVRAEFVLNREASFDNFVGFYRVGDVNGGIDTDGNGTVDLRPGEAGYNQAAVRSRVAVDLRANNQSTATFTANLSPGSIFAPFIIANGRPEAILDGNPNNDPAVYFPFLGANPGRVDHIRLLGNNTFGFEDLLNGGDRDYNDLIVKVNLSVA